MRGPAKGLELLPIEYLAGGKREVRKLDENDSGGLFREAIGLEDPGCSGNSKESGRPERGGREAAVKASVDEDDVEGSEDGEEGDLIPVKPVKGVEEGNVHEAVLKGPDKDKPEGKGVEAAKACLEEGKEAGKGKEETGEGQGCTAKVGKLGFDKTKGKGPQKGNCEQVEHGR